MKKLLTSTSSIM